MTARRLRQLFLSLAFFSSFPIVCGAQGPKQGGAWPLTVHGSVTVRQDRAVGVASTVSVDTTVYTGEIVQTMPTSAALLSIPGEGTIFVAPDTSVRIDATADHFVTLLGRGSVQMTTLAAGNGLAVGMGDYRVLAKPGGTALQIDQELSGSGLITCLVGYAQVTSAINAQFVLTFSVDKEAIVPVDKEPYLIGVASSNAPQRKAWLYAAAAVGGGAILAAVALRAHVSPSAP
jgi:hypothetical protein